MREIETAYHFLFDCDLYAEERLEMTDAIDALVAQRDPHGWSRMTWDKRLAFLLGDGPESSPVPDVNLQWTKMEIHLYRFLALAYNKRRQSQAAQP